MTDANGGDVEDLIKSAPPETASSGIVAGGETDPVKKLFAIGIVTFVVALVVGVSIALGVNSSGKSGELFFSSGWCVCVVLIIFCAR